MLCITISSMMLNNEVESIQQDYVCKFKKEKSGYARLLKIMHVHRKIFLQNGNYTDKQADRKPNMTGSKNNKFSPWKSRTE
jgi:hypothetical protein